MYDMIFEIHNFPLKALYLRMPFSYCFIVMFLIIFILEEFKKPSTVGRTAERTTCEVPARKVKSEPTVAELASTYVRAMSRVKKKTCTRKPVSTNNLRV